MLQFAEQFSNEETAVTLSQQLSWSHILILLPLKNADAKLFYAKSIAAESLGVRELRKKIANKEFERTAIANIQMDTNKMRYSNVTIINLIMFKLFLSELRKGNSKTACSTKL